MVWAAIGHQLRHPRGWAGRLVGHLMALVNHRPNRLAITALAIRPEDHVLDLGCGPGAAVALMARQAQVTGIDQSRTMLAQARRRNRKAIEAGRVVLLHSRFERLPLADGAVDRILAVNVAYFWAEPAAVLSEARRVLKDDGLLAVYVTDAAAMRRWKFAGHDTHRLFDAESLAAVLAEGGFALRSLAEMRVGPRLTGLVAVCAKPSPSRPEEIA